jgi:redox-sensitive bicupin YhaK (pirin superfamily)
MKLQRGIERIIKPSITTDGAGVVMKRSIATSELDYLDPFLLFDHFGSADPDEYIAGFPMHPHRGIETITYMVEGEIKHRDSSGNEGIIGPGDIQWMTAGSGIMHEEMPQIREGKMEGFQLWVNLPAKNKMMRPRYQEYKKPEIPFKKLGGNSFIKVIAGEYGEVSGIIRGIEAKPTYLDVNLEEDFQIEIETPSEQTVFAYIYRGGGDFKRGLNKESNFIDGPKLIIFKAGDFLRIRASERGCKFLLIAADRLNEPTARYGPFVMNSREEIEQALTDLQTGNFVKSYD